MPNLTYQDLAERKAIIEFAATWDEDCVHESFAAPKMRARVIGYRLKDDVHIIQVDFSEFEEHNRTYENHDWNGPNGPTDARSAGFYKPQEDLWMSETNSEVDPKDFSVIDDVGLRFHQEWRAGAADLSYIRWLEQKLIAAGL